MIKCNSHIWEFKEAMHYDPENCGCGEEARFECTNIIKITTKVDGTPLKRPRFEKCRATLSIWDAQEALNVAKSHYP